MRLFLAVAVIALSSIAASAEDWSSIRCEEPEVIEFIKKQMAGGRFEDGTPIANYLGDNSRLTATTISAQRDRFACRISIVFTYSGSTERIRGQFILREFANGKITTQFIPN